MHDGAKYKEVALVMDLKVSGLGTIRSLSLDKRINIVGIGDFNSPGRYSKHLSETYLLKGNDVEDAFLELIKINDRYEKIIPFPTGTDFWVHVLCKFKDRLGNFFIDYNEFVPHLMRKDYQHRLACKLSIPFAETRVISNPDDLQSARELAFPVVVKAISRNTKNEIFRIKKYDSFDTFSNDIPKYMGKDKFLVSRFVSGPDSNLYTFGSYAKSGKVIMEFTGRKLTQKPSCVGVVGIAEEVHAPRELVEYSKKLINEVRFSGISQIEYKKNDMDDRYYLMEINPRSWMWIYLSTVCGKNLPLAKYYSLTGRNKSIRKEYNAKSFLFIDESSLIINLFREKKINWIFHIIKRLFSHKFVCAVFATSDIRPFLNAFINVFKYYRRS